MNISINSQGYVDSWAIADEDLSMRPIIIDNNSIPADWNDNAFFYKYNPETQELIFDEEKAIASAQEEQIFGLRAKREQECFSIINRGQLWYEDLTQEQIEELRVWYHDWLNVTNTLIEPERPAWLD